MYKETLNAPKLEQQDDELGGAPSAEQSILERRDTSKVNAICDAFLKVLQTNASTNPQNVVTAHVCKSPPDLEAGLKLVARLRSEY